MHPPPPPERREAPRHLGKRRGDPPGPLARFAVALQPWRDLLTFAVLVGGVAFAVLTWLGVGVTTTPEAVEALAEEQRRLRTDLADVAKARAEGDAMSEQDRRELREMLRVIALQNEEALYVTCTGLDDGLSRRLPTCRRVLGGARAAPMSLSARGVAAPDPQRSAWQIVTPRPSPQPAPADHARREPPAALPGKAWPRALALVGGVVPEDDL